MLIYTIRKKNCPLFYIWKKRKNTINNAFLKFKQRFSLTFPFFSCFNFWTIFLKRIFNEEQKKKTELKRKYFLPKREKKSRNITSKFYIYEHGEKNIKISIVYKQQLFTVFQRNNHFLLKRRNIC